MNQRKFINTERETHREAKKAKGLESDEKELWEGKEMLNICKYWRKGKRNRQRLRTVKKFNLDGEN
jgi:hypothetical protein